MDSFINSVKGLLDKMGSSLTDEIKLGIIGGALTVVIFLLAWLFTSGSRMNSLRKKLLNATKKINKLERVDEENVEEVYEQVRKLPDPVGRGWGRFMEQKKTYPSDYIQASDVLNDRVYSGKNAFGKAFFCLFSVIIWAVVAILSLSINKGDLASVGLKDFTENFSLIASIVATLLISVVLFVLFYFILGHIYTKQRKRLEMNFESFLDVLDSKVLIDMREEETPSDIGLENIAEEIDELTRGRMDDYGQVEVITVPDPTDVELEQVEPVEEEVMTDVYDYVEEEPVYEEPAYEEEPVYEEPEEEEEPVYEEPAYEEPEEEEEEEVEEEEPVYEEPVYGEPIILTQEEKEKYLSVLTVIVDAALADPETTDDDISEIAVAIDGAMHEALYDDESKAILEECLMKLADRFFA